MTTKTLLLPCEVARLLGQNAGRFQRLANQGKGPPCITLPNGDVRYDPDDVWAWVQSLKQTPTAREAV